MNPMPVIEGLDTNPVYDNTKQLFADYGTFSTTYEKYISCNNMRLKSPNPNSFVSNQCSLVDMSMNTVSQAYNVIMNPNTGSYKRFDDAIPTPAPGTSQNDIMELHGNKVVKLRKDIEEKIKMLEDIQNSVESDYVAKHEATMYASALMSIVASSAIYYFFVHMN